MSSMNLVVFIGRMVNDIELKYTNSGKAVGNFRIAVNRTGKGPDGKQEADFFSVTAWDKTAEFVSKYLGKGKLVSVRGRLQNRQYTAQDGQQRQVTEVVAEDIRNLSPRDGASHDDNERALAAAPAGRQPARQADPMDDYGYSDNEIPF